MGMPKSQRIRPNEDLREALLSRWRNQNEAAFSLGIDPPRISNMVKWRAKPSATERAKLEAALGAGLVKRLVGPAKVEARL